MVVKFLRPSVQTDEEILDWAKMVKQHYTHHAVQKWGRQQIQWQL